MHKILFKCRFPSPHFYGPHCTLGRLMTVLVQTVTNVGKGNFYGFLKVGKATYLIHYLNILIFSRVSLKIVQSNLILF